jgi:hypothetical protein
MHICSVLIDGGSALGTKVAVTGVEIECTDAVFAADTLELYPQSDPIGGVVSHPLIVILCSEGRTHHGGLSKVTSLIYHGVTVVARAITLKCPSKAMMSEMAIFRHLSNEREKFSISRP